MSIVWGWLVFVAWIASLIVAYVMLSVAAERERVAGQLAEEAAKRLAEVKAIEDRIGQHAEAWRATANGLRGRHL